MDDVGVCPVDWRENVRKIKKGCDCGSTFPVTGAVRAVRRLPGVRVDWAVGRLQLRAHLLSTLRVLCQRVSQQSADNERHAEHGRYQPVRDRRKLLPKWQVLAVINVESNEQQNVRGAHTCDMQPGPVAPASPASRAAHGCRCKREHSKDE